MSRVAVVAVLALAASVPSALAEPVWRVDPAASSIVFRYSLAGVPQAGRFGAFRGEGRFDSARPEETRFDLVIEVASLDLGLPLVNAFALSADWFDAASHPVARYRLARLTKAADGTAASLGDLVIKGRLKLIEVPVSVEIGPDRARATGTVRFDPVFFGVGVGPSALFVDLGDGVDVSFDLVARPSSDGPRPEHSRSLR